MDAKEGLKSDHDGGTEGDRAERSEDRKHDGSGQAQGRGILLRRSGPLSRGGSVRAAPGPRSAEIGRVVACELSGVNHNPFRTAALERKGRTGRTDRLGVVRKGAAAALARALVRLRVEERRLAVARKRVPRVTGHRRRNGVVWSRLLNRAVVAAAGMRKPH